MNLKSAWRITIEKWSTENKEAQFYLDASNCGLCLMFFNNNDKCCIGCPINKENEEHHHCQSFSHHKQMSAYEYNPPSNPNKIESIRKKGLAWLLRLKKKSEGK